MEVGDKIKMSFKYSITDDFIIKDMTITNIRFKHHSMFNVVTPIIYLDDLIVIEKQHLITIQEHIKNKDYRFAWILTERLSRICLSYLHHLITLTNEFSIDEQMKYQIWISPVKPIMNRLFTMSNFLKMRIFFSDFNLNEFINYEIDSLKQLKNKY
jgi:hypothetical protein